MPITREKKQQIINNLKEKILKHKIIIFVTVSGLKTKSLSILRKKLKAIGAEIKVVKKSLMSIVFKESKLNLDSVKIEGEAAFIFGYKKDEISSPKIVWEFSQENFNLKILGGILENNFIDSERIIELAKLPSKQELLGKLITIFLNPILNFINILQSNTKNLIYVLNAIKKVEEKNKN